VTDDVISGVRSSFFTDSKHFHINHLVHLAHVLLFLYFFQLLQQETEGRVNIAIFEQTSAQKKSNNATVYILTGSIWVEKLPTRLPASVGRHIASGGVFDTVYFYLVDTLACLSRYVTGKAEA